MITVKEYKISPTKHRVGVHSVEILSANSMKFILFCDLVIWKKDEPHMWIRMPEMWKNGKKQIGVMVMPEDHKTFQDTVLQQLNDRFGVTLEECKRAVKEAMKQHMKRKCACQTLQK